MLTVYIEENGSTDMDNEVMCQLYFTISFDGINEADIGKIPFYGSFDDAKKALNDMGNMNVEAM